MPAAHRHGRARRRGRGRRARSRSPGPSGVARVDRPRRRPGRRDPRRGLARRATAGRRRPGSGPAARGARPPHPALGPPDRRAGPDPPARGPRRRAAAAARALPRRAGVRARDARARARLRRVARAARRPSVAPPRLSIAAGDRLAVDDIALRVLWPIRGQVPAEPPDTGTGINNVSVVLLGTVGERRFLLAGDVEEDIDPSLLAERPAARRPAQGRAPRQPDRDDRGRSSTPSGRGSRWPRRAPATRTAIRPARRSTGWRRRRARLPHRPGRHGDVAFDADGHDRPARAAPVRRRRRHAGARRPRRSRARRRSFLCAVPIQPFVARSATDDADGRRPGPTRRARVPSGR